MAGLRITMDDGNEIYMENPANFGEIIDTIDDGARSCF